MFNTMMKISILTIIMTSIMSMMVKSWLQLWLLLEINMMAFIPLLFNNESMSINAMLKYFFIQALASSLFLFSIIQSSIYNMLNPNMLMMLSMMTKLGMFPMFMWFPQISKMISWNSNFILMTIQKFMPYMTLMYINNYFLFSSIIFSTIISTMGMWNQISIQMLLAYSSINHMCWMLIPISMKNFTWIFYLMIYSFIMLSIIIIMKQNNMNSLIQIKSIKNYYLILSITMSVWSLSGLPPLLGFMPKWFIINMIMENFNMVFFMLILSSLINMMIYTRMLFPSLMKSNILFYNNIYFYTIMMNFIMLMPSMLILL